MKRVLLSTGMELVPAEAGESTFAGDQEATRDLVQRLFLDPWDRIRIRELLAETLSPSPISEWTDDQVLELLARQISTGEWAVVRRTMEFAPPERKKEEKRAPTRTEKTGWIEIELVDDFDKPVPGEPYRIELPDGKIVEGTLNAVGCARDRDIESGECKISFPRLDQEVWKRV